jgi:hypothetical protein
LLSSDESDATTSKRPIKVAFGLDLGGYSAGRSAFVRASLLSPDEVEAVVYRGHAFSKKPGKGNPFVQIVEEEVELLARCLDRAPLYADVPIDLQGLPCPGGEVYAWQLVKRPVDFAFGALPPLADHIGSVVARFRNVLLRLPLGQRDPLGGILYETYPAGSLRLLGLPHKGYKGEGKKYCITYDTRWVSYDQEGGVLAGIANELGMFGQPGQMLNHDEFDAVVCALTGVVDSDCLCQGEDLETFISEKIGDVQIDATSPKGYALIRRKPEAMRIAVRIKTVSDQTEMFEEISRL